MAQFHLKINQIKNYPPGKLLFEVRYSGIDKTEEFKCSGIRSRTCSKIWNLSVLNVENNKIEIIAKTKKIFHKSIEIGRMTIPFDIIRPNSVLNDWFLIRKKSIIDIPLLIEISLHHNCSNEVPFSPIPLQLVSFCRFQPPDSMFICSSHNQTNEIDCIPIYDQYPNSYFLYPPVE
jgi:hypothetical protein